jgi:phage/plasmid-like protein (TIGR03299 family)
MPAEIIDNMLAYKGQTPWHGLGYSVPLNATGADMLNTAKLNWQVQRRSIAMRPGDGDRSRMLVDPLSGYRAIVRSDNDQVFQVATDRYQPVQNAQIVDFFREYCEAGNAIMETVGGLKGGAIVWALAKLNGGNMIVDGVDELRGYMLLATSHDGSVRTVGKPTQVRVVCWNTLSAALQGAKGANEFRMKHTRKWTPAVAKEAQEVMGLAIEQVRETNTLANKLSHVRLDGKGKVEFLHRLLNSDKDAPVTFADYDPTAEDVDRVLKSFEADVSTQEVEGLGRVGQSILEATYASPGAKMVTADGTMWGMVNGVSFYSDHIRGRAQDSRLANAWFGAGDLLKRRALEVATEMAGIA